MDEAKKLIKKANKAEYTPSQRAFDRAAKEYVHRTPPKRKEKKKKATGKFRRHKERVARGISPGFGKSYSAPEVVFRVEFALVDEEGEEDGWQIHWIHCRKFQGKEYRFLKDYFDKFKTEKWNKGETLESEFVLRYIAHWLIVNKDIEHLNLAFIYPSPKVGNETIRTPIYEVRWNSYLAEYQLHPDFQILMAKCIWHEKPNNA